MFKQNPSIFFQSKSGCITLLHRNPYLIKGERSSLPSHLFYEPRSQYIANQIGFAKETVSPKNIEMFVLFVWEQKTGL